MSVLHTYSLEELMFLPLPSITEQKRLMYRPTRNEVYHVYELLNYYVFKNELKVPIIRVLPRRRKYWGMCVGRERKHISGSYCEIEMMDKWYCPQWMIATLAHEMCHQYQWDIVSPEREELGYDPIMSHGPSFFMHKKKLDKHYIPLKTAHSRRRWFMHQDLYKT